MATYKYRARTDEGKTVKGIVTSQSVEELHLRLKEQNLLLLKAVQMREIHHSRQLKDKQLSDFCRQLGTLTGSGITVVRALTIIGQQEDIKRAEERVYHDVLKQVRTGIALSDAMEQQGGAFPEILVNMIHSAEISGNLSEVAMRMAVHYDKQWKLNTKVRNAMTYPKLLTCLLIAVVCLIMCFVLPQFYDMFSLMDSLPLPTRILMGMSSFVTHYYIALLLVLIALIVSARKISQRPSVRLWHDRTIVHIPVIGNLEKVIFTSRFARTLSSLYASGTPIVNCLTIAGSTIGNSYIESQLNQVLSAVRCGKNLSDALGPVDGFVKKLEYSVRVGEETGALESMLESTADSMEYESEMALNRLVGLLEPAMIILMAIVVGFVMLAVIVPIYSSYQTIGAMG